MFPSDQRKLGKGEDHNPCEGIFSVKDPLLFADSNVTLRSPLAIGTTTIFSIYINPHRGDTTFSECNVE